MANKPAVRKVLRTVGKEALGTSRELLLGSLKGDNENSRLKEKISQAKERIVKSIVDAKNNSRAKMNQYHRLNESDDEDEVEAIHTRPEYFPRNSNSHMKSRSSLRHVPDKKRKLRGFKTKTMPKRRKKYAKTIFD
ncbi:MAG TPA: hypothetical protein EYQ84_01805 [Nitrospinaceae bacterium]|nr:hypothetical protein [Nitrospinaceae bacterium]